MAEIKKVFSEWLNPIHLQEEGKIPPMTDPLGKYWEQPKTEDIIIDDKSAIMSTKTFGQLKEYSTSQPSGVYHGKMWKKREWEWEWGEKCRMVFTGKIWLVWYGYSEKPNFCSNNYREIIIID